MEIKNSKTRKGLKGAPNSTVSVHSKRWRETTCMLQFIGGYLTKPVVRMCSIKWVFLKISWKWQESLCQYDWRLGLKLYYKRYSSRGTKFLQSTYFAEHLRMAASGLLRVESLPELNEITWNSHWKTTSCMPYFKTENTWQFPEWKIEVI